MSNEVPPPNQPASPKQVIDNVTSRPMRTVAQNNQPSTSEISPTPKKAATKATPKKENNKTQTTIKKEGSGNKLPCQNQPAVSLVKIAPTKVPSKKKAPQISKAPTTVEKKDSSNKVLPQEKRSSSRTNVSAEVIRTKKTAQNIMKTKSVQEKIDAFNNKPVASQNCPTTKVAVKVYQNKAPMQNDRTAQKDKTVAAIIKADSSSVTKISTKDEKSAEDPPLTPHQPITIVAGHQMGCTGWQLIDEQIPSTIFYRQVAKVHAQSIRKLHEYQSKSQEVSKTQSNAQLLKRKRIAATIKRRKQVRKVPAKK